MFYFKTKESQAKEKVKLLDSALAYKKLKEEFPNDYFYKYVSFKKDDIRGYCFEDDGLNVQGVSVDDLNKNIMERVGDSLKGERENYESILFTPLNDSPIDNLVQVTVKYGEVERDV